MILFIYMIVLYFSKFYQTAHLTVLVSAKQNDGCSYTHVRWVWVAQLAKMVLHHLANACFKLWCWWRTCTRMMLYLIIVLYMPYLLCYKPFWLLTLELRADDVLVYNDIVVCKIESSTAIAWSSVLLSTVAVVQISLAQHVVVVNERLNSHVELYKNRLEISCYWRKERF